jgi:prepilin-type N-terminal cleavage/methylation domain-containing protein
MKLSNAQLRRFTSGFTMIELLVAITILLLLLGSGIASYVRLNDKQTLVTNGRKLQLYFRTAQKRARVGDKPTGCVNLTGYSVVAAAVDAAVVQLNAICTNATYLDDSFTLPAGVAPQTAINVQFKVLQGGASPPSTITLTGSGKSFSFTIGAGGDISEGTYN